jgi:hypothetical protein
MSYNSEDSDLADRIANIEQTIGDIAKVLKDLKASVNRIPSPDCPPYCAHAVEIEYPDTISLEARVVDIRKCIGDVADVFGTLRLALNAMPEPDCPPYCGAIEKSQQ